MSNNLQLLETWAGTLLAKLQPAQRRNVNLRIAIALRRNQAQRIASQRTPDGRAYVPRKNRSALRSKWGRIQRRKGEMFRKIRLTPNISKPNTTQIKLQLVSWVN